jgi:hypothetical protein
MHQQLASAPGLLRTLLLILILFIAARILGRILTPWLQGQKRPTAKGPDAENRREGEVRIEYLNKNKKKDTNPAGGEYVDYKEVD